MARELPVACGLMPPAIPELDGVEHTFHDLPTGVRIHLAAAGPADAPPVLALHGWPQHWWAWRHVIGELAGEFRLLCPDLRGLGWSGAPADDDFRKQRLADDAIALLDALGLERVRLVGHDWGGYGAILAAVGAPERFSSLLAMSIGHPWVPTKVAIRNGWMLAYQLPLAAPFVGEEVIRDGRYVRGMLIKGRRDGRRWTDEELDTYIDATREAAHASSKLYRDFLLRELGPVRQRPAVPAKLLIGSREPIRAFAQGFPGELDVIEGAGHFLPEEAPHAVAERIRAM
jgi:pimeloyl-ACP methyl ester carboxylesterase